MFRVERRLSPAEAAATRPRRNPAVGGGHRTRASDGYVILGRYLFRATADYILETFLAEHPERKREDFRVLDEDEAAIPSA